MNRTILIALASSLLAIGCSSAPDPQGQDGTPGIDAEGKGPAAPIDHPPVDPSKIIKSAQVRRLTIQQVRRSFPVALGLDAEGEEIAWKIGTANGLDKMSDSLGEADFIDTTEDGLEPSPLYLKFMDDAARDVCNRALDADAAKADKASRVLFRHVDFLDTAETNAAGVDTNLRYLKLRLHGVQLPESDAGVLPSLRGLYTNAVDASAMGAEPAEDDVEEGWRVVCVTLLVAPEFHVY